MKVYLEESELYPDYTLYFETHWMSDLCVPVDLPEDVVKEYREACELFSRARDRLIAALDG